MNESLTLRPSLAKWILMLLGCTAATGIGAMMIRDGEFNGWFVAGFSALGVSICVMQLWPSRTYLRLDSEGFTVCTPFKKNMVRWGDIKEFGIYTARGRRTSTNMVCFNLKSEAPRDMLEKLSSAYTGYEAGLPDTYGYSAEDLMRLMEDWRVRNSS